MSRIVHTLSLGAINGSCRRICRCHYNIYWKVLVVLTGYPEK